MTKCEQCSIVLSKPEHKNSLMAGSRTGDVVFKCHDCRIASMTLDFELDIGRYDTELSQTAYDAVNGYESWD